MKTRTKRPHSISCFCILAMMAACSLSGCILVPFIDAFKKTGATEGDRMALLAPEVQRFTEAIGWGKKTEALGFVLDESRKEISTQLKKIGAEERVVDSKVDEVEWANDAFDAHVAVKVQYFMVPYYVVKTRTEQQHWVFSLTSGWKLKERIIEEG
jgi:hypothetical protein